jgi:hypothetical protein
MQAGRGTGAHAVDLAPLPIERENLVWHALDLSDAEAPRRLVLSLNLFAIVSFSA